MNEISSLDAIKRLQLEIGKLPQAEFETRHYFADGMYCRELIQPKGATVIGKVHRKEHFYMVLSGELTVVGEGKRERIKAPCIWVSMPGTKRALYAHEDSVYVTVHKTELRDLDEIEKELVADDPVALFDARNTLKFDVPKFRELTIQVIKAEKPGFWSDWTKEEQGFYQRDDWYAFSLSRGYTVEQIEDYGRWRDMVAEGFSKGMNPYAFIVDLACEAAEANIRLDVKGEILKSSHLPFEVRKP